MSTTNALLAALDAVLIAAVVSQLRRQRHRLWADLTATWRRAGVWLAGWRIPRPPSVREVLARPRTGALRRRKHRGAHRPTGGWGVRADQLIDQLRREALA